MGNLIYVVEDEASIRELYSYILEGADYKPCFFENSEELFLELANAIPDLFILDIMLEGEDGFQILSRLKSSEAYKDIPVIIVSAKGEELSKVKGLNLGADDYIAKPFGVLELVARVKANLRKAKSKEVNMKSNRVSYKDIVIDDLKHSIEINGVIVKTTLKEYKLLKLLCNKAETAVGREEIFSSVWGCEFIGETRTLDIHIRELRKKLKESESSCEIETLRGVGYMLK